MAAKVFIVNYASEADYKVFFVNYSSEQKNHQLIAGGKLVKYKSEGDVTVFIVNYASEATIKILRENFPK
jgi:hypothetical protein